MHSTDRTELSRRGWANKPLSEMNAVELAEAIVLLEQAGEDADPALRTALHEELSLRMSTGDAETGAGGTNVEVVLDECN